MESEKAEEAMRLVLYAATASGFIGVVSGVVCYPGFCYLARAFNQETPSVFASIAFIFILRALSSLRGKV